MKLAGKDYESKFPIMSCIALETAAERGIWDIAKDVAKGIPSFGLSLTVIWAGLLHSMKDATPESVAALIESEGSDNFHSCSKESYDALSEALATAIKPKAEETENSKN